VSAVVERTGREEHSAEAEEAKFLWPPIVFAVLAVWVLPLFTSLELDETGVWWVVKDGLRQAIQRAHIWPLGQSILYDSILTLVRAIAGDSDFAMRLPSALTMIAALYLLYRLGRRLIGPLGAMFACLVFVTMREVVYVASTMRPYALVPFFTIGAVLVLLYWLESGKWKYAAAYVVLSALAVHANYFAALMFPVHAVLVFVRIRDRSTRVRIPQFAVAWGAVLALLAPLIPFCFELRARRGAYSYLPAPGLEEFLGGLVPGLFAGAIAVAILLFMALRKPLFLQSLRSGSYGWFLAIWAFLPAASLFAVSELTSIKIFAPRYYIASAPALALLAGALLRSLGPRSFRLAAAAAIVVTAVIVFDANEHTMRGAMDWRAAANAVRDHVGQEQTPILAVTGFHEGTTLKAALDATISDAVFAPYLRYPFGGRLVRVPVGMDGETERYLEKIVTESLAQKREFFVVGLSGADPFVSFLSGRCASMGFTARMYGYYGGVMVTLFQRGNST
jgi:hypothetical protein